MPVVFRSTAPGSQWKLNLAPAATQGLAWVDVRDSDASGGQTILARSSVDPGGNNLNWRFPAGTVVAIR